MEHVWAIALILLNTVWLALVVIGLPGNWLMVVSALLLSWWAPGRPAGSPAMFSLGVLIAIAALALAGEIAEFGAGLVGVRQGGGTRRGALGALVGAIAGGIIGTFFIPLFGSLVGACVGAALGAWALELSGGRSHRASLKSGAAAGVGRLAGTIAKLGAGIAIWLTVGVAAFWR